MGSVEAGGGADPVALDTADVGDDAAGAAIARPTKRRAHTQEVKLIILTTGYLRSKRKPIYTGREPCANLHRQSSHPHA